MVLVFFITPVRASERRIEFKSGADPSTKPFLNMLYDVPTDDPVRSRPMPLGYAHEPPDAGTRARPGLAVGVLQG